MLYFEIQTTKPFIVREITFKGHSRLLAMAQFGRLQPAYDFLLVVCSNRVSILYRRF